MNAIRYSMRACLPAAKSRQDFTANVSHELKTPLTAISGYAELIENGMVEKEQQIILPLKSEEMHSACFP